MGCVIHFVTVFSFFSASFFGTNHLASLWSTNKANKTKNLTAIYWYKEIKIILYYDTNSIHLTSFPFYICSLKLIILVACDGFSSQIQCSPPEWCDWLFLQRILLCKCLWWIRVEERIDNPNSEINPLSNFSNYEKIPWIFWLETPCFTIGHFYNHHWKLKSFIAFDQDRVIGIRFTPPPRIVGKKF